LHQDLSRLFFEFADDPVGQTQPAVACSVNTGFPECRSGLKHIAKRKGVDFAAGRKGDNARGKIGDVIA
jgi:hypothetical protein